MSFCRWLERTPGSVALHESLFVYPIVESFHVLALCLFLGFAILLDLRLAGITMREVPVSQVASRLLPWTVSGFAVMMLSGALLFYAVPVQTYENVFFRIKAVFLVLSGLNVWWFHATIYRRVAEWDRDPVPPIPARCAGFLSLFFWTIIVVCGRMIAYNWFDKQL